MTRTAFRGTLVVNNDTAGPVTEIEARVYVVDESGAFATGRFGVRGPVLSGINAIDGGGVLVAGAGGTAVWTFIPAEDAAPTGPTVYRVGGILSYTEEGRRVTVPLAAVPITVRPDAALDIKYFLERDVLADDPFTPELEPSVPFSMVAMVKNRGAGAARNLTLSAPQARIVENEKGLLVGFSMVGSELNGSPVPAGYTMNFGRLDPGALAVARWWMQSTVQGLFIDYKATLEHLDDLGEKRLSTFKSLEIHEMIHVVRAPFGDDRVDYLVNDDVFLERPDAEHVPDAVHLSDGTVHAVGVVREATVSGVAPTGAGEMGLVAGLPAGFGYLRILDPAGGSGRLDVRVAAVRRSDGRMLAPENFWQTDRTFVGMGRPPVRENLLHLFDHDSTGQYTLVYEPREPVAVEPPESAVAALPATSPTEFPVQWTGRSRRGGAVRYDVWVSADGGAFAPWLRNTTQPGAIFQAALGKRYAFYSTAVDETGNRELAPNTPDTETQVAFDSTAPTVSDIGDLATDEDIPLTGVPFILADSDTGLDSLVITAVASNPVLFPPGAIRVDGTGADRTLALTPAANQHGTCLVTLTVGDGTSSVSTRFNVLVRPVNDPPVAGADVVTRRFGRSIKVPVSQLLANDRDVELDPLEISGVTAVSAKGAAVELVEGWVSYLPPSDLAEADTFHYTLADRRGGSATGEVQVHVIGIDAQPTINIVEVVQLVGGAVRIDFVGIPGREYRVEATESLSAPNWLPIGTATADGSGRFQFTDADALSHVTRFYRSAAP